MYDLALLEEEIDDTAAAIESMFGDDYDDMDGAYESDIDFDGYDDDDYDGYFADDEEDETALESTLDNAKGLRKVWVAICRKIFTIAKAHVAKNREKAQKNPDKKKYEKRMNWWFNLQKWAAARLSDTARKITEKEVKDAEKKANAAKKAAEKENAESKSAGQMAANGSAVDAAAAAGRAAKASEAMIQDLDNALVAFESAVMNSEFAYCIDADIAIEGALNTIKTTVTKWCDNVIAWFQARWNDLKNTKVGRAVGSLINRIKNLRKKADKATTAEEAAEVQQEMQECKEEVKSIQGQLPEKSGRTVRREAAAAKAGTSRGSNGVINQPPMGQLALPGETVADRQAARLEKNAKRNRAKRRQTDWANDNFAGRKNVIAGVDTQDGDTYNRAGHAKYMMKRKAKAVRDKLLSGARKSPATASFLYYDDGDMAMESAIDILEGYGVVEEGLFRRPKPVDKLLGRISKTVDKKCKTAEDCDDYLARLTNEEQKFNAAISDLKAATQQYQEDGDKKALKTTAKPILTSLKKTCDILNMDDIAKDGKNLTEDDLTKLRDYITGAKQIIADKKSSLAAISESYDTLSFLESLQTDDDDDYAMEGYDIDEEYPDDEEYDDDWEEDEEVLEAYVDALGFDEYFEAMESIVGRVNPRQARAHRIMGGETAKKIAGTVKAARQAKKNGQYDEAIKLYKQAIQGYRSLMAQAKKISNETVAYGKYADGSSDRIGGKKATAINWLLHQIEMCQDAIEEIADRRAKGERKGVDYEGRARAKADQRAQRRADREARKAARQARKNGGAPAPESYMDFDDEYPDDSDLDLDFLLDDGDEY